MFAIGRQQSDPHRGNNRNPKKTHNPYSIPTKRFEYAHALRHEFFYPQHRSNKHSSKKRLRAPDNSIRLREKLAGYLIQIESTSGNCSLHCDINMQTLVRVPGAAAFRARQRSTVNISLTREPDTVRHAKTLKP